MHRYEDKAFVAFVALVSLAFAWVISPFYGAILWGIVAAIMFAPLNRWFLKKLPGRANMAASVSLLVIVAVVIVPAVVIGVSLVQEIGGLYVRIQSNEFDLARVFATLMDQLPAWARGFLERFGLTEPAAIAQKLSSGIAATLRWLAQGLLGFGQGAAAFLGALGVMLYLTFFLLRDGQQTLAQISKRIPLYAAQKDALAEKFTTVIRATIKGSVTVALIQGIIGGVTFWGLGIHAALLGGVMMGIFSLLPAIGTGIVWVPVAIYLLATGAVWQGIVLTLCGIFIIGMVDNLLRPILVGKETRMPDYLVLISTLGGLAIFGLNGFLLGPVVAALFLAAWDIFGNAEVPG